MKSIRIFISHSTQDKALAQLVVTGLQRPNMASWIDHEQIITGDDIFDQIGHGLRSMDVLVFLVSKASLESEWVQLEVKYAVNREVSEKRTLVLPFIVDDTAIDALPWFLSHRNATRVAPNPAGAEAIVTAVRKALERRSTATVPDERPKEFAGDPRTKNLIAGVNVGDWTAADLAAIQILRATDKHGSNERFQVLLQYIYHATEEDELWSALMTVESCAQLAPWLISRELLHDMAHHSNFSVRSSAASICMDFAEFAPDRVPTDLLFKLAVHNEDWYVQAPATAALKAMARFQPAVMRVFFARLHSSDPDERAHAAAALAEIAQKEPEILSADELEHELTRLKQIGDKEARDHIAKALSKAKQTKEAFRFKYGI